MTLWTDTLAREDMFSNRLGFMDIVLGMSKTLSRGGCNTLGVG